MFERILFAAHEIERAHPYLEFVRRLAREHDSEVVVLHVGEVPANHVELARKHEPDVEAATGRIEDARRVGAYLTAEAVAAELTETGVRARSEVRAGRIAEEVLKAADDIDVDVIVIGGGRRNALTAMLTGSITAEIVRKATRPVLVVPRPAPGDG